MTVTSLADPDFDALRPSPHEDLITEFIGNEAVSWAPGNPAPTALDPVEAVVFRLLDGRTSMGDLVADVHETLGVPATIARARLRGALRKFDEGGLLITSRDGGAQDSEYSLFPGPLNP